MDERTTWDRTLLQSHRILLRAGLSLTAAFSWVFVFEYVYAASRSVQGAFVGVFMTYIISQATTALLTPVSASHLRSGVKRSMIVGVAVAALALAVLGATFTGYFSQPQSGGIILFGLLFGLYRALYWIPYRLQSAPGSGGQHPLFEVLIALMPAFAGLTLIGVDIAPLRLLFGAAALIIVSMLPIFPIEDTHERFDWGYRETFARIFERRNRTLAARAFLSGIESATLFVVWPLSIFLIVGRSYFLMGLILSASLLILLAIRESYRIAIRRFLTRDSIILDIAFASSGWILRLAAGTPLSLAAADSYSYIGAPSGGPEFFIREHAADSHSYLDEFTALQEIGIAFGRIATCVIAGVLVLLLPLSIALALSIILAAIAAGWGAALAHKLRRLAY